MSNDPYANDLRFSALERRVFELERWKEEMRDLGCIDCYGHDDLQKRKTHRCATHQDRFEAACLKTSGKQAPVKKEVGHAQDNGGGCAGSLLKTQGPAITGGGTKPVCCMCNGAGAVRIGGGGPLEMMPCHCNPKWSVWAEETAANAGERTACPNCKGTGIVRFRPCPDCENGITDVLLLRAETIVSKIEEIYGGPLAIDRRPKIHTLIQDALTAAEERGAQKERERVTTHLRTLCSEHEEAQRECAARTGFGWFGEATVDVKQLLDWLRKGGG